MDLVPCGLTEHSESSWLLFCCCMTPHSAGTGSHSADWELYESQTRQFQNFLIRANRYPSLKLGGSERGGGGGGGGGRERKVVLVEVSYRVMESRMVGINCY